MPTPSHFLQDKNLFIHYSIPSDRDNICPFADAGALAFFW